LFASMGTVLLADVCIIICSTFINNMSSKRHYPLWWHFVPPNWTLMTQKPQVKAV